ncbi:MAG: hypothetical protein AUG75_10295 [Cyanobacteria bacterium 13_1_20CM_4_61_6]|nr:MAG: hypothetical protein AUG75_10295 [Cyanobacteria bacterium 13_1_20CM_4_61_6]
MDLTASTNTLNFGNVGVLTRSAPLSVTLTNVSNVPIALTSISIGGVADYADFAQRNNCPNVLLANATCTVQIVFTPTRLLKSTGSVLLVRFTTADSPLTVSLLGNGVKSANNAVPYITQPLVPATMVPGASTTPSLQISGTGFTSHSVVRWNGKNRATTFVSKRALTAALLASDVSSSTTAAVTVANPTPGGGVSNAVFLPVTSSTPLSVSRQDWPVGNNPSALVAADFNQDGNVDLAVANTGLNTVSILLGNGDGTFPSGATLNTGDSPSAIAAGDFNGDGRVDLIVANTADSTLTIFTGDGKGGFTPAPLISAIGATDVVSIVVADFDGDGRLDLAVANQSVSTISIFLGNGDATFRITSTPALKLNRPSAISVGDFNGDGVPDLAIANRAGNTITIAQGRGDGTFTGLGGTIITGAAPASIGIADFNGDGFQDLAVANKGSNSISIFPGNGNGTFKNAISYSAGAAPNAIAIGDLNGDGFLDLVTANGGSDSISVLLGTGGGSFQAQTIFSTNSGPQSLVIADFNRNGKLDVAVPDSAVSSVSVLSQ